MIIKKRQQGTIAKSKESEKNSPKTLDKKGAEGDLSEKDVLKQYEIVDVTNIEFKERLERRRGDRRRGYRRIDERALVSRAQEEAHSIKNTAKHEGYQKGIEQAEADLENLRNGLRAFLQTKSEAYNYVSKDILELALEVAKKIIKKEVELSDTILEGLLKEVLEQVNVSEQKITIKVAPEDLQSAKEKIPELLQNMQFDAKILIISDENIEKGSCILEATNGVVDADFKTQLQIIQNAFGIYKGKQE